MNDIRLCLYDVLNPASWATDAATVLTKADFVVSRRSRTRLDFWQPARLRQFGRELQLVEGYQIDSSWSARGRLTVRIHPRRYYFEPSGGGSPARAPEYQLLRGRNRPPSNPQQLISGAVDGGQLLTQAGVMRQSEIDPHSVVSGLVQATRGMGAHGRTFDLQQDLWRNLSQARAFLIPDRLKIMLIHDADRPNKQVQLYGEKITSDWLPALGFPTREDTVCFASLAKVLPAIRAVQAGKRDGQFDDAVFLVAISGHEGDPLPFYQEEFLQRLDIMGLPYRCFSADNAQPKWSSRAQLVSIISGAGGTPYRLKLPYADCLEQAILIGVDLGHDAKRDRISQIVVSVLDNFGGHIISCRRRQPLDESITDRVLGEILERAKCEAQARIDYPIQRALVFRDGLIPARSKRSHRVAESPETYRRALKVPVTLVELRKRGNPLLYRHTESGFVTADSGTACAPLDAGIRFFTAYSAMKGLPRTFKARIADGLDELDIGVDGVTAIAVGLCYSLSLGLKPHLPGPIYWADGFASTRDHSYKFAGQPVVDL